MQAVVIDPLHYAEVWFKDIDVLVDSLSIDASVNDPVKENNGRISGGKGEESQAVQRTDAY